MKYVVVIPAKNEAEHLAKTLTSIEQQTLLPARCVIVNDGSTDSTGEIADDFAKRLPFVSHYARQGEPSYSLGGKVVRVFNEGKALLDREGSSYDVIIKLDADTSFGAGIAEAILGRMERDRLGIASGTPYLMEGGRKVYDYSPTWHTHGQFKFYRREVLEGIGGLRESLGWDSADNIHAMHLGWDTCAFRDITYEMHRQVGGKTSLVKGRRNHGRGAQLLGYDPAYFALRALHDVFKPPFVAGAVQLVAGYLEAPQGEPLLDEAQRRLLRRLLWGELGKRVRSADFALLQRLKTLMNGRV